MPQLNLTAKTKEEQKVKAYLEANASSSLAEKINNGVKIQKDGKTMLNKKTLSGFMKFACDEAKKQAEKGAQSACIDDDIVYGWAVHYFEEDSIEDTLYNEDGTEYKAPVPKVTTKAPVVKAAPPKPQPKPQLSMFDMLENNDSSGISATQSDEEDDEPTEEEVREAEEQLAAEEKAEQQKPTTSPVYQKYLDVQRKYPQAIVAMRLGDFYEVFGDNAKLLADELPLTLTGRDCGLESRVPMVGFPYHASDMYLKKILSNGHNVVLIENDSTRELPSAQNIDLETGEILPQKIETNEPVPTVSNLLSGYTEEIKTNEQLEQEIAAIMKQPEQDEDDDFDIEAFNASSLALLYEKLGDDITLR